MTEDKYAAMRACLRFRWCRVPICPLDPEQELRVGPVLGERRCPIPPEVLHQLRKLGDAECSTAKRA